LGVKESLDKDDSKLYFVRIPQIKTVSNNSIHFVAVILILNIWDIQ